jgi:glycosyltransferase involved in cell wall biosynthesis
MNNKFSNLINKINSMNLLNIFISFYKRIGYAITEPFLLKYKRYTNKIDYKNRNPFISVYVPTYNRGSILIERAIKSILRQTYKNFELIIIGDCCTDDTTELVKNIDDVRIKYFNIPTRGYRYPPTAINHWYNGPTFASNVALSMIKGDWIARNDDDDIWTDDHLEKLVNFAIENDFEFVSSHYKTVCEGVEEIIDMSDNDIPVGGTQTWLYRSYLNFFKYNPDCWRKKWNRVNDTDLQERIFKAGARIGYLKEVTTIIYPRPGEVHIGSKAYLSKKEEYENFYKY